MSQIRPRLPADKAVAEAGSGRRALRIASGLHLAAARVSDRSPDCESVDRTSTQHSPARGVVLGHGALAATTLILVPITAIRAPAEPGDRREKQTDGRHFEPVGFGTEA
jgi:hypothetical protein